ncbi:MAG: DEAD/DEAH box helicase [Phycisphaerae bacterium]|nr:DEAD/DEAH box helicase [Phycisphaerae bacterium]
MILKAVEAEGYTTPTPIQAQTIPIGMTGRDLLGIAQTGTGKTAAFALPILHRMKSGEQGELRTGRRPRALILAPTRELAAQIGESFATYGKHLALRHAVIFGGVGQNPQVNALKAGVDVLVATPGRLIDLMDQGFVHLDRVSIFVLDEADRMLDMGFIKPIQRIAAKVPKDRQTMLFSATMPSEIQHLANQLLRDPAKVAVTPVATTVEKITQSLIHVPKAHKVALLVHLLKDPGMERVVAFTKMKHGADRVMKRLRAHGIKSEAIHGNKGQNQRIRALEAFREGRVRVLVATDIAARGLDIDGITHVVNVDLPMEAEAYVHRIGRTARAGASGAAISFCDSEERGLLRDIEKLTRLQIPVQPLPTDLSLAEPPASAAVSGESAQQPASGGGEGRGGRGKRGGRGRSRGESARGGERAGQAGKRGDKRGEQRGQKQGEQARERRPEHRGDRQHARSHGAPHASPKGHQRDAAAFESAHRPGAQAGGGASSTTGNASNDGTRPTPGRGWNRPLRGRR